jgi:hypothetical protein
MAASDNESRTLSMPFADSIQYAKSSLRHYTRPGFLASASVLACTFASWWIIDHNHQLERWYSLDDVVLVLGIASASLLYVCISLWLTLQKELVQVKNANKAGASVSFANTLATALRDQSSPDVVPRSGNPSVSRCK